MTEAAILALGQSLVNGGHWTTFTEWTLPACISGFCPEGLVGLMSQLLEVHAIAFVALIGRLVLGNVKAWVLQNPEGPRCKVEWRLVDCKWWDHRGSWAVACTWSWGSPSWAYIKIAWKICSYAGIRPYLQDLWFSRPDWVRKICISISFLSDADAALGPALWEPLAHSIVCWCTQLVSSNLNGI